MPVEQGREVDDVLVEALLAGGHGPGEQDVQLGVQPP